MKKDEFNKRIKLAMDEYVDNNVSLMSLSEKYGIAASTISQHLKKNGFDVKFCTNNRPEKWKLMIEDLKTMSIDDVAKKYNVDRIVPILANEGLTVSKWKGETIKLAIEEYKNASRYSKNISAISAKYGLNKKTLKKYLVKEGVEIIDNGTKCEFNRDAFDVIDTEEKAYWLGFMYADGYITSSGHSVGLNISLKDINHLKKYGEFLNYHKGLCVTETHQFGSKEKVNVKGEPLFMVSTVIADQQLWDGLNSKGCVPNKSLILTFPDKSIFKEEKLVYDFLRGYVDGDGTLGVYPHSKSDPKLSESLLIVGTKSFLEGAQEYLGKGFLMQKKNCNEKTYRLGYGGSSAHRVADLLYQNATVYLDRKYDVYINKFAALKSGKNGES